MLKRLHQQQQQQQQQVSAGVNKTTGSCCVSPQPVMRTAHSPPFKLLTPSRIKVEVES